MSLGLPVIIIGAGGHAKVLIELMNATGATVAGLTDTDPERHGDWILGHPVLGGDEVIDAHAPDTVELIVGIGTTRPAPLRRHIYETYAARGYRFRTCIHPETWVSPDAVISDGAQIMAGAIVQPDALIGTNSIINTRASIDHDCRIGNHAHIAPGAVLGGAVRIGNGAHIGTGAIVIENVTIGEDSLIAAGACVIRDVADGSRVGGVPAKPI